MPAEVQVRARLPDPERADDQPALRDPRPPGARALPRRRRRRRACPSCSGCWRPAGGAAASATPRRSASSAAKATQALVRYHDRFHEEDGEPVWFERAFQFRLGPHLLRGRVDRVDRLPDGGYELIDYKTGRPKTAAQLREDVQLSLYAVGARESWQLEAARQAYYYVLDDEKVPVERSEEDRDWITETVLDGRRGHPVAGLRADAVLGGVLDVRLPDRLPGGRALMADVRAVWRSGWFDALGAGTWPDSDVDAIALRIAERLARRHRSGRSPTWRAAARRARRSHGRGVSRGSTPDRVCASARRPSARRAHRIARGASHAIGAAACVPRRRQRCRATAAPPTPSTARSVVDRRHRGGLRRRRDARRRRRVRARSRRRSAETCSASTLGSADGASGDAATWLPSSERSAAPASRSMPRRGAAGDRRHRRRA